MSTERTQPTGGDDLPTFDEMFPGKYLSGQDVRNAGDNVEAIICSLRQEEMMDRKTSKLVRKWVAYFDVFEKGYVMNVTNGKVLRNAYGSATKEWIGRPIVLTAPDVDTFGETKPTIRFALPKAKAKVKAVRDAG